MKENIFSSTMKKKSDVELIGIIKHKSKHSELAIQAVLLEIEERGIADKSIENKELKRLINEHKNVLEKDIPDYNVDNKSFFDRIFIKDENQVEDSHFPPMYSKNMIFLLSCLFSPFFGATLLFFNLKEINKTSDGITVVCLGIIYTMSIFILGFYIDIPSGIILPLHIFASKILTENIWNRFIGKNLKYRRRKIIFI